MCGRAFFTSDCQRIAAVKGVIRNTRASIQLGCDVKNAEGCTLRWSSDNSKVLVDSNGKVTCKGLFGAKKANITVEVIDSSGNVVAKDTVPVVFYKLSFQLSNAVSQAISGLKRTFDVEI